jgi:hypothetical protein
MADLVEIVVNPGLWRRCRIEALWWAWVGLQEPHPEGDFTRARALCAGWLLEMGEVP